MQYNWTVQFDRIQKSDRFSHLFLQGCNYYLVCCDAWDVDVLFALQLYVRAIGYDPVLVPHASICATEQMRLR